MSIEIDGVSKRIGLALSGGGFRAAGFHLGVFKKLDELGLLSKIDLLSCVSGGSIAGGVLAKNWNNNDKLNILEKYLRAKSVVVSSVLAGAFDPFESRLDKLAKSYDRHLFDSATLDDLRTGPRIYFNATNLATGNLFFFVAGENMDSEMGEHELGTQTAGNFALSRAVAASSAFPPVFPPLKLGPDEYHSDEVEYVTLTDGGVYDNLAINPTLRLERNRLDYIIVSDAGKPFSIRPEPGESGSEVIMGTLGIMMEQLRGLQLARLELSSKAAGARQIKPIWFSIDSQEGAIQREDPEFASAIGTNLKKLTGVELGVLTRHSSALLEHRLKKYAPELINA